MIHTGRVESARFEELDMESEGRAGGTGVSVIERS